MGACAQRLNALIGSCGRRPSSGPVVFLGHQIDLEHYTRKHSEICSGFLREEGVLEETKFAAIVRLVALQLAVTMQEQKITTVEMIQRPETRR